MLYAAASFAAVDANKANAEAAKQVSVTNPFFISSKLFFDTCFS